MNYTEKMPEVLWRIEDIQRFTGIKSRATIYKLMRKGLKSIKLEGSLRFNPETVKQYFKGLEA